MRPESSSTSAASPAGTAGSGSEGRAGPRSRAGRTPPTERPPTDAHSGEVAGTDDLTADHTAYLAGVMAEIDAEVRRRRASGDIPPGLEHELDELFLEFSPVGMQGKARLRETLSLVDRATHVDISVPLASEKMVGSQVKRLIRSSISWYMGFVVHQVVKFHWATSRMFHVVADRLETLETQMEDQRVPDLPDTVAPAVDLAGGWWSDAAVAALAGARGRVLHADCGDGALLDRLVAAGVDAYGVDPTDQVVEVAADRGLDVRAESSLEHLELVGGEELAGVVLSGSVQWLSPSRRERLLGLLASRLAPDGVLVLHSSTPEHWSATQSPLVQDLAPGRPLHPETWAHVLGDHGFEPPRVTTGGGEQRLEHVPESQPASAVLNQAIDVVNQRLLGPNEYLLVTTRAT